MTLLERCVFTGAWFLALNFAILFLRFRPGFYRLETMFHLFYKQREIYHDLTFSAAPCMFSLFSLCKKCDEIRSLLIDMLPQELK